MLCGSLHHFCTTIVFVYAKGGSQSTGEKGTSSSLAVNDGSTNGQVARGVANGQAGGHDGNQMESCW